MNDESIEIEERIPSSNVLLSESILENPTKTKFWQPFLCNSTQITVDLTHIVNIE